jgi:hypothetical protein
MTSAERIRFIANADALARRIEMMRTSDSEAAVTSSQLEFALGEVRRMRSAVNSDQLAPREARGAVLTRVIVDTWPLGHKIGRAITELEEEYRRL